MAFSISLRVSPPAAWVPEGVLAVLVKLFEELQPEFVVGHGEVPRQFAGLLGLSFTGGHEYAARHQRDGHCRRDLADYWFHLVSYSLSGL
jgi:hypothetical protein